ncbi:sn-glycerol-1-phosphate dehydrogenase [Alkalicoccus halolimnae]|uniref:Sn-glycerol-1-phosphate dehydrogenase n=1 Tax=Alkalicoccus halolimnae TaxID=1667239 RepID=A0A5C7FCU0_9BACI|nr:sn-glycerol-1-phosphate dehydrogenase [Alkalicoccus halolimnae]TXF85167.1 sn-glycerol-1-phosphate dehydrogenase [Alkalicoccus halolimnae]
MHAFHEWYDSYRNNCSCGRKHERLTTEEFLLGDGVLKKLCPFLKKKNFTRPLIVCDKNTKKAAGNSIILLLDQQEISYDLTVLSENDQGDVLAEETALVHTMVASNSDTDVLIAVGSGTIHDISRFVSYKMKLPFISVPTAPSVDGFNSKGAPIVLNKKKVTYQTQAPIALFGDINILKNSPQKMIAAGFADMLGKHTSMADWEYGKITAGEPYCGAAALMTREALQLAMDSAESLAEAEEKGIYNLMTALIYSGMAMALFGHSHPASGGEHHLSHYWEMIFLKEDQKQLLHGEKVGAACGIIADHYHQNKQQIISAAEDSKQGEIKEIFNQLPSGESIRNVLACAGGKSTAEELHLADHVVENGLKNAHLIRDRHTMLRTLNSTPNS